MKGPERPCSIKPQQTSLRNVLQRPVEPAARSGHSTKRQGPKSANSNIPMLFTRLASLRDDRDRREVTYAKNLPQLAGKLIRGS
jgi:hypothetical protein